MAFAEKILSLELGNLGYAKKKQVLNIISELQGKVTTILNKKVHSILIN